MARDKSPTTTTTTTTSDDISSSSSSSSSGTDKEEYNNKEKGRRRRRRGPGPTVVLAALVSLLVSSAAGVALAGVLITRQRDRLAAPDEAFDPAFYLARDLILFASAMAILYVALHVRAARRRAYCCVRCTAGSDGDSSGDGDSTPDGHNDSSSSSGGGGGGGGSGHSMRTTMRKTQLPPHLRGNYLHASALLVARLAIVVWIAALIATAVMIARAGPIPFRYADGTKKGFVGAVPVLNLLICIGAIPPFVIISATIEKQHAPFATRGLTKASFLTCRVSAFGDDLEHGTDDDDKLLMMSVSRRASLEQQRTRQQQQQQIPSTTNDDAITMSSLEIFQQGARLMAGLGSRLIGKSEPPVPEEPARPPSPPEPAYNPGGWREEWNKAAEQPPSPKPAPAPAKDPGSRSATRYTRTCTQTTQAVATRTEKVTPRTVVSPPSSTNPPSMVSPSHYTSSQYSADNSTSSQPSSAPIPPPHCSPQPCHCKDPPVSPPNELPSTSITSHQPQVHSTPLIGPRPGPIPMPRPRPRPRPELGPRPAPSLGPRGPAAPSTSIASSGRRTGLSTVRYAERPDVAVQQPLRVFVPGSSVATSFASSSASSATASSIGPIPYPSRHYDVGAPRTGQPAAARPLPPQPRNLNPPPARSEPAPAPRYLPPTVEEYDEDDDFGAGVGGWTAPAPVPSSAPVPVSNLDPDPNLPSYDTAANAVSVLRNAQRAQKTQGARPQHTATELAIGTGLGLGILEKEQPKELDAASSRDAERKVPEKDVVVRIPGAFGDELE